MATSTTTEIQSEEEAGQVVINAIATAPRSVRNQSEYDTVLKTLTDVKLKIKKVEAFWETIKLPLRKTKQQIDEKERAMIAPLEGLRKTLDKIAGDWFSAETARKKALQDAENKKHEEKVTAAIEAGKDPVAVAPPKVIEQPRAMVKTETGASTSMRMVPNWRIKAHPTLCQKLVSEQKEPLFRTDPRLAGLPDSVWELNTKRLKALAESGTCDLLEMYDVPSSTTRG